jgi:hypothetical protein
VGITLSGQESQIAQNLPSLEGYLGQRQYASALIPMNPDNTIGRLDGQTMAAMPGGYVPYAGQGVGSPGLVPQGQGMVPVPPQPQVVQGVPPEQFRQLQDYALQLEQANYAAAQQAIAAEEQAFLYAIADLPEEEKVIAWQQRQIDQLAQANGHLSHRVQSAEEAAEEEEQAYYKDVVAEELCRRAGINYANPQVEAAFMAAQTKAEMDNLVGLLTANRPQFGAQQPQQLQQPTMAQRQAGLVAAQGVSGVGGRAVQIRQGDLGGYLKAKGGYQVAYQE